MNKLEEKIKYSLQEKADLISPSPQILRNIKTEINKEANNMTKLRPKRILALCLVACGIFTVGAIGAGVLKGGISTHSSINEEIHQFPTLSQLENIIDYKPKYVEKLGNYDFKYASPEHSQEYDEYGNVAAQYNAITFWYNTDKGMLTLSTHPRFSAENYDENDKLIEYKGLKLYYSEIKYKFVPPDYELTDEDKKLMDNKELEVSYGSDKVEYMDTSAVVWEEDNIVYCISNMDAGIDEESMINMAKEVVDSEYNY